MAVDSKVGSLAAGRSKDVDFATGYVSPISYNRSATLPNRLGSSKKLTVLTSTKSLGNASSTGSSPVSPQPNKQTASRAGLAHIDTNMTSYTTTATIPASNNTRSESRLSKLHKRASSGSSLPATPSPLATSQSQSTTPYTTYEDSYASTPSQYGNSSLKSRPYIRKLSSARDDENQGRLDLSKSVSETGYLPGLGIQDYGARSVSEVTFAHTSRRVAPHTRTTSGGSQISVASRSFTPTQPFVHPMRQTPNGGPSYASSMNDEEAHESSDIVADDGILAGATFRARRSESISSTPHIQPTPLSQSYTAADLGCIPKYNTSQTNLSTKSGRSGKSSRSKLGRPRRNTERSDHVPDPSTRTSTDKAFSVVSRRSDTDAQTRDERIREKRRQFNEKEASKDRKREREELKRRETDEAKSTKREERQGRRSSLSQAERPWISQSSSKFAGLKTSRRNSEKGSYELRSRSYKEARPAQLTALPKRAAVSEKTRRAERNPTEPPGMWPRFSTWLQTRLLSCGRKG